MLVKNNNDIDNLITQAEAYEKKATELQAKLADRSTEHQRLIEAIKKVDSEIESTLSRIGGGIESSESDLQKIVRINRAYDAAVDDIRGRCLSAIE